MAETDVPPWLHVTPDYFLSAIRTGSEAGLQRRGQDIQQQEAADRLRLAYDQLGAEQQQHSQEAAAKLALAQQAMALRQQNFLQNMDLREQQAKSLADYRDMQTQLAGQRLGEMQRAGAERLQAAQALLKMREQAFESGKIYVDPTTGEVLQITPSGQVNVIREAVRERKEQMDPLQRQLMGADVGDLKRVQKELGEWYGRGALSKWLNKGTIEDLETKRDELREKLKEYSKNPDVKALLEPTEAEKAIQQQRAEENKRIGFGEELRSLVDPSRWVVPSKTEAPQPVSPAAISPAPTGRLRVKRKSDGQTGWVDANDPNISDYDVIGEDTTTRSRDTGIRNVPVPSLPIM